MSNDIYYKPYTYHIAWTSIDKHYYGVRYAKGCNPNDLWKSYFTSSKLVLEYRQKYGEPDIIQIRRTFDDAHIAKSWEAKVLRRLNVLKSSRWLNANIGGDQFMIQKHSPETKRKMSENSASKRPEERKRIAERQLGSNNSFYGKKHTEESKKIRSEKCKGYYWWTNGLIDVKSKKCPQGFWRGKSLKTFLGKKHTKESRAKISAARKSRSTKILALDISIF